MDVVRRYNKGLIPKSFTVPDIYNGLYTKACPLHGWQKNKRNHDEKTCHSLLNWDKPSVKSVREGCLRSDNVGDDVREEEDDIVSEETQRQRMAIGNSSHNPDTSAAAVLVESREYDRLTTQRYPNKIRFIPFDARPDEMQICSVHGWWRGKKNHGDTSCREQLGAFQTKTGSNPFKRQRVDG